MIQKALLITAALVLGVAPLAMAQECATCACNNGTAKTPRNADNCGNRPRDYRNPNFTPDYPWHGNYYHTQWGTPVALVVPPTATYQSTWRWGVSSTMMRPIYHQFGRAYPGNYAGASGTGFYPTPAWPSSTDQFGVYPVRGPW